MGGRKYGFIGSKQRESLHYGQVVAMGVRTYGPHMGRFLQTDPVLGGSANTYEYANQDPVNVYDVDGRCVGFLFVRQTASGRFITVATDPLFGTIKTVIRSKKIPKRLKKVQTQ